MKKMFPWSVGKGFDLSAPMTPITAKEEAGDILNAEIFLQVNGVDKQRNHTSKLIWNCAEIIMHLSQAWELQPGDLIFTGTPKGVGPIVSEDLMSGGISGLTPINVKVL